MNWIPLAKFQLTVTFCVVIVASSISMSFAIKLEKPIVQSFLQRCHVAMVFQQTFRWRRVGWHL